MIQSILSFFVNLIVFLVVIFMWISVIRFVLGIKSDGNFSKSVALFLKYCFQFLGWVFRNILIAIGWLLIQVLVVLRNFIDWIIERF